MVLGHAASVKYVEAMERNDSYGQDWSTLMDGPVSNYVIARRASSPVHATSNILDLHRYRTEIELFHATSRASVMA